MNACELCDSCGGELLWQDEVCRVIRVGGSEGVAFPGFCRVVWKAHVAEMSDLTTGERQHLLDVVQAVERAVRTVVQPDKINLASLGNVVPHLHWHVIARFDWDSHFPTPVWGAALRDAPAAQVADVEARLAALDRDLVARLSRTG